MTKMLCSALMGLLLACPAAAQDRADTSPTTPWSVRLGAGSVNFGESADISLGGAPFPGAGAAVSNNTTLLFSVDYRFSPDFSVEFAGGIPPTTTLTGTGALAGTHLGKVTYAPAVLTLKYHFTGLGADIVPYVGAGVNYTVITDTKDGAIQGFKVKNAFAPAVQLGFETNADRRFGFYADAKWIFLETEATGTVGGTPARADITLDPLILGAGIVYRF